MIAGARHWMTRLSGGVPQLKERLLDRLISRGVLRQDERRILGSGGLFGGFVVLLR